MKPASPAKPAAPKRAAVPAHHPASSKHKAAPSKKHKASGTAKHTRKTGLALHPDDVQCCAAQALAASLRLAPGEIVHDEDVLALYWRTARGPDEGASILDTLKAAREYGLGGGRPVSFVPLLAPVLPDALDEAVSARAGQARADDKQCFRPGHGLSVILRLDLPEGPHAVTAGPDGSWWSWGEPCNPQHFSDADITEAWAVTW